jgi:hypothetical protein
VAGGDPFRRPCSLRPTPLHPGGVFRLGGLGLRPLSVEASTFDSIAALRPPERAHSAT